MWRQSRYALTFFKNNRIPFWQMSNNAVRVDSRTDWLLSSSDDTTHVVYRRSSLTSGVIDMAGLSGSYSVRWFNPRVGGGLQIGSVTTIASGGTSSYGLPPNPRDTMDWAILIRKI
jgi:Putative collagen-binding domain of a collagenase